MHVTRILIALSLSLAPFTVGCAASDPDPVPACLQSCSGCCQIDGTCQAGNTTSACGLPTAQGGRGLCSTCTGTQVCSSGTCGTPSCPAAFLYGPYTMTGANAAYSGNTANCTPPANERIPTGMKLKFDDFESATVSMNGVDLSCLFTQNNCTLTINCVNSRTTLSNVVFTPDMKSFTADVLIVRPNDECNYGFKATGSM